MALAPLRPSPAVLARLSLIGAALLFSTGGAVIKLSSLDATQIAAGRSLVASLTLLLLASSARQLPRGPARLVGWLVPVAFGATMLLFVLANRYTTAAGAVVLQATAPIYVLLIGPVLLRERLRPSNLVTLVGMGLGLWLFVAAPGAASASAPRPVLGNTLGAITGLTWALAVIGLRWIGSADGRPDRRVEGLSSLSCVTLGNALVVLVALPFAWPFPPLEGRELVILLWLGSVQIGLAYLLATHGLRHVPAFEASLLFLVEPVLNPLWAWLVHGEDPGPRALVGCALILVFAAHAAWESRQASHST